MSHKLAALLLVLVGAGCINFNTNVGFPVTEFDAVDAVFIGGVHTRYHEDNTIEVRAYFVNVGAEPIGLYEDNVTAIIATSITSIRRDPHWGTSRFDYVYEKTWQPGGIETLRRHFPKAADPMQPMQMDIRITVSGSFGARYEYACFNASGITEELPECAQPPAPSDEWLYRQTESNYYERLRSCCQWLPPPVDPIDVTCSRMATSVDCSFVAWNWMNATATVEGEFNLTAIRVDGTTQALGAAKIEPDSYAPGERRQVAISTPGLIDPAVTSVEAYVRMWRVDLPKSVSDTTVTFPLVEAANATGRHSRFLN